MSKSELNDILRFGTQELFKDDNAKDGGENCSSCLQEFFLAWYHYDYQLSSARQSFGDEVLDLKYSVATGTLSLFPMVTIALPVILHALFLMTSNAN